MEILIIKLSAIGDVIQTLPALNALRRHYPGARITWLSEAAAAPLIEGHEALDRLLVSRRKEWLRGLRRGPDRRKHLREMACFVRELRSVRYDLIIDFQQLFKSGILAGLARGKRKAGFGPGMQHMEQSYRVLTETVPAVSMEHHALLRYLMLLEKIGVPVREVTYRLPVTDRERQAVSGLLARHDLDPARLVAINPVARWETKLWENEKFAELADRLVEEEGADVVFTGGPEDRPVIREILSRTRHRAVNLAGETSLKALAALYQRTRLVITTDTGPMHLAAATETPTVALFGPTAPWRTGPFGTGHSVIRRGIPCSPCFRRFCPRGDRICMTGINTEEVLAAVRRLRIHFPERFPLSPPRPAQS